MRLKLFFAFLLACVFLSPVWAQTKAEAESGTLQNGGSVANSTLASGGQYVQMQEGNLELSVTVASAGLYTMNFVYSNTYGDKFQNLVINGEEAGQVAFPQTGAVLAFSGSVEQTVRLNAGTNSVAITKSWGWIDLDYIELAPYQEATFDINPKLVTPNPSVNAQKLYHFLRENFAKKIISGVQTGFDLVNLQSLDAQQEFKFITDASGKSPALLGLDFIMGTGYNAINSANPNSWYQSYNDMTITLAKEIWKRGGIPAYSWHWKDPMQTVDAFYVQGSGDPYTTFSISSACTDENCTAWNTNSAEYQAIAGDIDVVAGYLKELQNEGVAVLWRPVHEASGGWFWWGRDKKAKPFVALYNLIFDKLVNEHGLNNLIWVWNSDGTDSDWYPGDEKVDIIGRDFYYYPEIKNHASLIGEFDKLKSVFGTSKIITLSENGSIPHPENMIADKARWSYFMPWYGEHTGSDGSTTHNSASDWNLVMNHDYTITLESMPGWENYSKIANQNILRGQSNISVFPTLIRESVTIQCAKGLSIQVVDSRGKVIASQKAASGQTVLSSLNWAKGVYFVSVSGNKTLKTFKVIR
ncbi:MAG: T9SS type A sorting domain-containing protein [Fibrobacter sp.]|jgi:mannan endo-1,4-beta-mannosidase|nr:T9SS type A sorting domain-containing protein [Fibrobacter sp.]